MMASRFNVRQITGISVLTAVLIGLWAFGTFIPTPILKINFALMPIVVGACLFGPWCGLFLGVIDGLLVVIDPATSAFLAINPFITLILCVLKTGLAGLLSGYIFRFIKRFNDLAACILASLIVPIINTGVFILFTVLFFMDIFGGQIITLLNVVFTLNFLLEFAFAIIMSPVICRVIGIISRTILKKEKELVEE